MDSSYLIIHDEVHQLLHSKTRDTENRANYHFQQLSVPHDTHTRVLQIYAWLQVFLQVFFWLTHSQKLTLLIWTLTFHNLGPTAHSFWCARSAYINSFIIHFYWPAFFPSCLGRITTFKIRYNNFFSSLFLFMLVDEPFWWLVYTTKATEVVKWVNI